MKYHKGMDKDFNYREKYSGKNITEVGIKEAVKLQEEASKKKRTIKENGNEKVVIDKFGFGMCQFTGNRAGEVLQAYQEFYEKSGENHPTKEQCLEIEVSFMLDELKSENYKSIYSVWKKGDKTAYNAGYTFCEKYETPKDTLVQAEKRGDNAKKIYKIMKK